MTELRVTGGARIGRANATWPFATLTVNKDKLQLNATIIGNLVFKPDNIISIVPYSGFISRGLKINHKVSEYNDPVVFWTFSSPVKLIKMIEQTGFLNNTGHLSKELEVSIARAQSQGGFPIRRSAAIAIVVIWNILFLIDFLNALGKKLDGPPLGHGAQLALGFILVICILLLTFEPARRLILKEGRTLADIKKFVYFIMFISGFILTGITLAHLKN